MRRKTRKKERERCIVQNAASSERRPAMKASDGFPPAVRWERLARRLWILRSARKIPRRTGREAATHCSRIWSDMERVLSCAATFVRTAEAEPDLKRRSLLEPGEEAPSLHRVWSLLCSESLAVSLSATRVVSPSSPSSATVASGAGCECELLECVDFSDLREKTEEMLDLRSVFFWGAENAMGG